MRAPGKENQHLITSFNNELQVSLVIDTVLHHVGQQDQAHKSSPVQVEPRGNTNIRNLVVFILLCCCNMLRIRECERGRNHNFHRWQLHHEELCGYSSLLFIYTRRKLHLDTSLTLIFNLKSIILACDTVRGIVQILSRKHSPIALGPPPQQNRV
jgi:hypothetical protein